MKSWLPWILSTLVLALLIHLIILFALPKIVMRTAQSRILAQVETTVNQTVRLARPDETSRTVVLPSPDLLYTLCLFDVTDSPLHIESPVPNDTYWSVAFYNDRTDNFHVINDQQAGADSIELILIAPDSNAPSNIAGAQLIQSPTNQGLILFRHFIKSDAGLRADADLEAVAIQAETKCEVLEQ